MEIPTKFRTQHSCSSEKIRQQYLTKLDKTLQETNNRHLKHQTRQEQMIEIPISFLITRQKNFQLFPS
jgi:uncharacterized FlgJ-related protein